MRTALGGRPRDIVALVLKEGLAIPLAETVAGLCAAFSGGRVLSRFVYGVTPHDGLSFVAVPLVLTLVASTACVIPARRAARLDPLEALRGKARRKCT